VRALVAIIVTGQATPLDQMRNVAGCPPGILELTTRCLQTDPVQRLAFPSIVDELQRIKGSVRASRPSTPLRRADVVSQTGVTAESNYVSPTYFAPHHASEGGLATFVAPSHAASVPTAPPALSSLKGALELIGSQFFGSAKAAFSTLQADKSSEEGHFHHV
jgi:hypothetical protein